ILNAVPAQAGLVLEFFEGTASNNSTLSGIPFPNDFITGLPTVELPNIGSTAFVQVALHQTAGTTILNSNNGLAAWFFQATYDAATQPGNWIVPGITATSTLPNAGIADTNYSPVKTFRIGPGGSMNGGTQDTATAFRLGGLYGLPPPSPGPDANGR